MRAAALLAAVLTIGCKASFVEKQRRVTGPVPEIGLIDAGGGHVRYALKGPAFLVNRRKLDAFKKMAKYCGGAPLVRVTKEYSQDDVETPYHAADIDENFGSDLDHYKVEAYRHIEFECVKTP